MKYVVFDIKLSGGSTFSLPFVFPDSIVHLDVANAVVPLLRAAYGAECEARPRSAGSVNSADFVGLCYGKSETLKLNADIRDTQLLMLNDYGAGHS